MGGFLSMVSNLRETNLQSTLVNLSLSKIKELHGSFKSTCDTFAINLTDYEAIFNTNEAEFALWDTDNNGLIEALEIFTGITIQADSKAEDKIRFLFDLFDFNEIQSLSAMDLEFAIQCAVISTCKMFTIVSDLNETEITILVRNSFRDGVRITLPQLLKWAAETEEIKTYFKFFRMDGPEMISIQTLSHNELVTYEKFQSQLTEADMHEKVADLGESTKPLVPVDGAGRFNGKDACLLITDRRSLYFRSWLTTALQPLIAYRTESKQYASYTKVPDELQVRLEWVYGIRSSDTRKALQYTVGRASADSIGAQDTYDKQTNENNEEIVFFIAAVVVLLNTNVNKQRFYLSHEQEIVSIAVSTNDGMFIASGELALNPSIHVWSRKTLESMSVIRGLHSQGVHLLQFTNDNKFLVTCGLTNPSAVIIYDWKNNQVVTSTSIHAPTQEIFVLSEIPKNDQQESDEDDVYNQQDNAQKIRPQSGVVIISLREIVIFTVTSGNFSQAYLPFEIAEEDHVQISSPICGMEIIADYRNTYSKTLDIQIGEYRHIFLTGHKDGKVLLWCSDAYIGVLTDYKDEITCMTRCFEGLAICTWRGFIHIWDQNLSGCTKTIELSSLPFKILSFNITAVDYNKRRLLVLTLEGDVIQITLSENGSSKSNHVKAKRFNQICKINGAQKAMTLLHQDATLIIIAGDDGNVTSYDYATHELVDVWTVGSKITALASLGLEQGGYIVAVGTSVGNLVIRQDWEEIVPRYHACGSKTINDLQFSKNGLLLAAASCDKHIYLFQYADGDYNKLAAVKLENGFPISINFSYDSKKIVICTNQRKLIMLDPSTFQLMFKPEELSYEFWSNWVGRYPLITKSQNSVGLIPVCLAHKSNVVAAGDENGNIYVWRDTNSIKDHIGVNLTGHSAPMQRMSFTEDDKRIISLGATDMCIFQWKVKPIEQRDKGVKVDLKKQNAHIEFKIILTDESLINELNFCFLKAETEQEILNKETNKIVDNGLLIRGCNSPLINRLVSKLNFDMEEPTWKRPPATALILDHIYGVQASDRRNTVIYLHFQDEVKQQHQIESKTNKSHNKSKINYNNEPDSNPSVKIEYDLRHDVCSKHLVYFTSRFGILYSPSKNVQTFYQGHCAKISCIQKHPFRKLVATGEVSFKPSIHIWDAVTLEPIMVLETSHQGGVLHLAFSPDGQKLVSIGMDRVYSIQVFQWEQNRALAFRNLGYLPVFALRFFPYENSRFITCGYEHMAVWVLKGNHLTCQTYEKYECLKQRVDKKGDERVRSVLMCIEFLNYKMGHSISSDLLFGTSQGEITTYCSGQHYVLNENAHKGLINCIRVSDKISDTVSIITGGEDGFIKIWNISMQLMQSIDIRSTPKVQKDLKNQRCYGIQSLEVYCCDKAQPRRLLVGLRCGEVLEAIVTDGDQKESKQEIVKKVGQNIGRNIVPGNLLDFDFHTYVSAHSSLNLSQNQKKISAVVMPNFPILASVGDDETLRLWDLVKKQIMLNKYLGAQATSLTYSPDGAYLLIGLLNGVLLVLDAKVEKHNFGSYLEEYTLPSLTVLMSPKEAKAAVICIKFSFRGDYLAVSYNNESAFEHQGEKKLKAAELGALEPSFVLIYINKLSTYNQDTSKINGLEPYIKLMKIVLPLADFQSNKVLRQHLAVTTFDFSEDDSYLQMCVQKINHEATIETQTYNLEENIFVMWDIKNNNIVTNIDAIKHQRWPDWSMAPSINARFQGTEINLEDPIEERQLLFRELCSMSKVQRFSLIDNAICGSHLGGLYIFRFQALSVEKLKVSDFRYDFVRKQEMAAARCFSGHTSMIQSIEIFQDKHVMTTSVSDQCIVQWRVEYEDQHWELDFNNFLKDVSDPFNESLSRAQFDKLMKEKWSVRLQVSDINQGVSKKEYLNPAVEFELQNVIGRRAFDRRGNIKLDCMDRITYQAGSIQVFAVENDDISEKLRTGQEPLIKQVFLRPDGNKFKTISPELSCFCLSKDLRMLFCATAQLEANVYIWEVTTNMKLGEFRIPNVPIITTIKVSHDSKQILMLGQTKEYYQMITMVDWTKGNKVMFTRQFLHSLVYKIRDIEFMPNSTMNFVTCGIQHMCFWRLSGANLEYSYGELTIPKAFATIGNNTYCHNPANQGKFGLKLVTDDLQQQMYIKPSNKLDDDLENLFVTFMNAIFVGGTLITSGDDGFLYIWDRDRIVRRILGHEGSIFALAGSKQGLVVSGGIEGIVTLWRLLVEQKSNVKSLERLRICNLRRNLDPHQAVLTPECNVQSVCLGYNRIIVGMRTGSINEIILKKENKNQEDPDNQIKRWIRCSDETSPKSVGIDINSSRIFMITNNGLFSCWSLQTFDIIYQKNYQKKARYLQSWRNSQKVMLVFSHEIIVCDYATPKFDEKADYNLILNQITFATLSHNEQILGVATISAAAPEVTLYSTDGGGFMKLKQIFGFKASISYIDFSTDNGYMQVEDSIGEVTLYEIETDRPIKTDAINFELEWLSDGLRTYSRLKGVRHQYNQNNKIVKIKKLLGKPLVVVADQMGTIRLFNYPNVKGEPYYQCYSDHLFAISDCQFSQDLNYFITSCSMDKCIFKWKLKVNEEKMRLMIEEDLKKLNEITRQTKDKDKSLLKKPKK